MLLAVKNTFPLTPAFVRGTHSVLLFPEGVQIRVVEISGEPELRRRIESMGVFTGSVVTVLQHRGHAVLLKSGHTRIAFRHGEALKIYGEQILSGTH
jgi:Fe2+ transport system protein FeoA